MCEFCRAMEVHKNIDSTEHNKDFKSEYTVAIVQRTWTPKMQSKRTASRTVGYRYRGLGYQLNFCPECGRKL